MKPCPFCAESIQDAAIKCRFCGSLLVPPELAGAGASEPLPEGPEGRPQAAQPALPIAWIAAGIVAVIAALAVMLLLVRSSSPARAPEQAAAPAPAPVPHRAFGIAWSTPINEVTAQLASRNFRFVEQDEEGDHVFQGDIDGHPAVVVAMLARGALAKTIVIMVGAKDPARVYQETNKRLAAEYGPPSSETKVEGHPVTRWGGSDSERGTRLWTTITDQGDVAIHYESEEWPAEARRRRAAAPNVSQS